MNPPLTIILCSLLLLALASHPAKAHELLNEDIPAKISAQAASFDTLPPLKLAQKCSVFHKKKAPKTYQKKIVLKTRDGLEFKAIVHLVKGARANIVLCHPAWYDKEFMQPYAQKLFPEYNSIRFDFRCHGENSKETHITIGKKEVYEVEAAARCFKKMRSTKHLPTYGFGISMGGAALLETESQKHVFDALIIQSCFEKLRYQIKRMYRFFQIPLMDSLIFSFPVTYLTRKWTHFDLYPVNPLRAVEKITVPIFLIHAHNDRFIPLEAFHRLKKAGKTIIKTWTPSYGQHTEILHAHPEEYILHCKEFFFHVQKNAAINDGINSKNIVAQA